MNGDNVTRWLNPTTWTCTNHIPSAKLPDRLDSCYYYGCTSKKPAGTWEEQQAAAVATSQQLRQLAEPELISSGPSEKERRQGRTVMVHCAKCGATLWRRACEVASGRVFLCGGKHTKNGKMTVQQRAPKVPHTFKAVESIVLPEQIFTQPAKQKTPVSRAPQQFPCAVCGEPVWRKPGQTEYLCEEHSREARKAERDAAIIAKYLADNAEPGPPAIIVSKLVPVPPDNLQYQLGVHLTEGCSPVAPEEPLIGVEEVQPPAAYKRRGATVRVACTKCGVVLWRRPVEAARSTTFYCTKHRPPQAVTTAPVVVLQPPIQPSASERKRGATLRVHCVTCGIGLWRRPSDATKGVVFYCGKHRGNNRAHLKA